MFSAYRELGYVGPLRILSSRASQQLAGMVRDHSFPAPLDWDKGHAATSRALYDLAVAPSILDIVTKFIGPDVLLWGASIVQRPPGSIHPWHSDIESSMPGVHGVSVWLGLEHTSVDSSLQVISGSHRLGTRLQDVRHEKGVGRDEAGTETVLGWAREIDAQCAFVQPEMSDGEALFFDGRIWHSSENRSPYTRLALLLQYATAESPLRIPDLSYLDQPVRNFALPQPPCLLLRGSAPSGVNRIVQAPAQPEAGPVVRLRSNRTCQLELPLGTDAKSGWQPFPIFGGQTGDIRSITCHASSLSSGTCPHPPHQHPEEEILLVLDGEVQIILPDLPEVEGVERAGMPPGKTLPGGFDTNLTCRKTLRRGEFVYYPAQFTHTLVNIGNRPANYLMFKWVSAPTRENAQLAFVHGNALPSQTIPASSEHFSPTLLFEGSTGWLSKLHCHVSVLSPGEGYPAHHDSYDVGIVLLEGEVETAGTRVGPNSVIFYPAGEPHGMHNPGATPARYIVFEFHGSRGSVADVVVRSVPTVRGPVAPPVPPPSFLTKIRDPQRWKRKLVHWSHRIVG